MFLSKNQAETLPKLSILSKNKLINMLIKEIVF